MSYLHYEEEQRFSNVRWIWVALLILLLIPLIITVEEGEASQKDVTLIFLSTVFASLPVAVILFYSKLMLRIDRDGIHYRFFPVVLKWRDIPKSAVESYEVSAKRNILEKIELGYKRNRLNNSISMNITGRKIARIKLKDGRKIKIGTENPEGFERALRTLTSPDNQ